MRASLLPSVLLLAASCATAPDAPPAPPSAPHPVVIDTREPEAPLLERAPTILREAVPHVEAACGARFRRPPRLVLLTENEAMRLVRTDLMFQVDRRYPTATQGQKEALLQAAASASVRSTIARYSIATDVVVIVPTAFEEQQGLLGYGAEDTTALLRSTLAHELVHALDDERFDLGAYYAAARGPEEVRARAMVVEGRAVLFGRLAAGQMGVVGEVRDLLPGGSEPDGTAAWQAHLTYALGAEFLDGLLAADGTRGAEAPYVHPPRSTWELCHPTLPPGTDQDPRPAQVLARAGLGGQAQELSELMLRVRYSELLGPGEARRMFRGYRGGAQALHEGVNLAVLAFADEVSAEGYATAAGKEAPTERHGTLVIRAAGKQAEAALSKLRAVVR